MQQANRASMQRFMQESPRAWGQLCRVAHWGSGAYTLAGFQREWIDLIQGDRAMLIAPRGYLKSSIVNDDILGDVLFSPSGVQHQAMIVCDNAQKCRDTATELMTILASDEIQELFAGVEVEKVGNDLYLQRLGARFDLEHGRLDTDVRLPQGGATIGCYTVDTSRIGMHIDRGTLHLDDAFVSATALSAVQQESRKRVIFNGWYPMLGPHTRILVSGTRHTLIDEYGVMEAAGWPTNTGSRSAIQPDGTALWPDVWPLDRLAKRRREMGETAFRLQYQNDPKALEGAVFNPVLVRAAQAGLPPDLTQLRICGVDMAYGGKDYTAVAEAARHGNYIYLIQGWQKRYDSIAERYRDLMMFCYGKIVLTEANGPQRESYEALRQQGLSVVSYPIYGKSKVDRAREVIEPLLEQGRLKIADPVLANELIMFTGDETKHDDLVDAIVMACWYADKFLPRHESAVLRNVAVAGHSGVTSPVRKVIHA